MYRRIISLLTLMCIIFGTIPAFAEQSNTLNTEYITEENVIYNALQDNKKGISLFSNTTSDITSDFDIVLGFDMSSFMYRFDYNGTKAWIKNFSCLSEQVSEGARFAVVNNEDPTFTTDLNTEISNLFTMNYSGNCDIINLLEGCLNIFDNDSTDRNKIVIATTSNVQDVSSLKEKMNELLDYGVIPFVFVLDTEKNSDLDSLDYVYQCSNEMELRLSISELYLSFAELKTAGISLYGVDDGTDLEWTYISDYRPALDKYSFDMENETTDALYSEESFGRALTSILNIYGCLPAIVNDKYDLTAKFSNLKSLFNRQTRDFAYDDSLQEMILCWGETKDSSDYLDRGIIYKSSDVSGIDQVTMSRIERNLKMRFPNIIIMDNTAHIITSYGYDNNTAHIGIDATQTINFTQQDGYFVNSDVTGDIYVFNTYEYLNDLANHFSIKDVKVENESYLEKVHIEYPSTMETGRYYSFEENANDEWSLVEVKQADSTQMDGINKRDDILVEDQEMLLALFPISMIDGISEAYNTNLMYKIHKYSDITSSNLWYYQYVVEATNNDIVSGYEEKDESGIVIDSYFSPDGNCTRAEFVRIALSAAGFQIGPAEGNGVHWAENFMAKARDLSLLIDNTNTTFEFYDTKIERGEAAYILTQLFINNADNVLVATKIYNYDYNVNNYKTAAWNNCTAFQELRWNEDGVVIPEEDKKYIVDTDLNNALYQMYMNGVFQGSGDSATGKRYLYPGNNITRAEVCTAITKCLFDLDEGIEQISVDIANEEYPEIEVGTEFSAIMDADGKYYCEVTIDKNGTYRDALGETTYLYNISATSQVKEIKVYDKYGQEMLPTGTDDQHKNQYRIPLGDTVRILFKGSGRNGFRAIINSSWGDNKKFYIVLNDSYSQDFAEELGEEVTSRYHNQDGKNYEYDKTFFETYFNLLGNRQAVFILHVRDLYFDSQTIYEVLKDDNDNPTGEYVKGEEYINNSVDDTIDVAEILSDKYSNMIALILKTRSDMNVSQRLEKVPLPEIYIDSPDFRKPIEDEDASVLAYGEIVDDIYTKTIDKIFANRGEYTGLFESKEAVEEYITGIGFGREDPNSMYKSNSTEKSAMYKMMEKVSDYAHLKDKKVLWAPYSSNSVEWENIGEIVNTGKDLANGKNCNILDVLFMQPGLFFSDNNEEIDNENSTSPLIIKQRNLKNSVYEQWFLNEYGEFIGITNEDTTKPNSTEIVLQIEYDISLVTGRLLTLAIDAEPRTPKNIAKNFVRTYNYYKDLIYSENYSIGIYAGGPNEKDYINIDVEDTKTNDNKHTIINHPSGLARYIYTGADGSRIWMDEGEGLSYNSFFAELQDAYNVDNYENTLIYDITKGILYGEWLNKTKEYLGM